MISEEDQKFISSVLNNESDPDLLEILEKKMKDPDFANYYHQYLDEKYQASPSKKFVDYLPMIILSILIIIGFYLIFVRHK